MQAIATGDAKTISTAPGVGKKVAEKIIVELKNKMGGINLDFGDNGGAQSVLGDLLSALESLGYRRLDIIDMAQKLVNDNPGFDVAKLVPMALKEISSGK
jgi:Holliday junction DNA helicase RuvA